MLRTLFVTTLVALVLAQSSSVPLCSDLGIGVTMSQIVPVELYSFEMIWNTATNQAMALAGQGGHLYRSVDGGVSWQPSALPNFDGVTKTVWWLWQHSADPSRVVAFSGSSYLWTTADFGNTWTYVDLDGFSVGYFGVAAHRYNSLVWAVGASSTGFVNYLWVTQDGGLTWTTKLSYVFFFDFIGTSASDMTMLAMALPNSLHGTPQTATWGYFWREDYSLYRSTDLFTTSELVLADRCWQLYTLWPTASAPMPVLQRGNSGNTASQTSSLYRGTSDGKKFDKFLFQDKLSEPNRLAEHVYSFLDIDSQSAFVFVLHHWGDTSSPSWGTIYSSSASTSYEQFVPSLSYAKYGHWTPVSGIKGSYVVNVWDVPAGSELSYTSPTVTRRTADNGATWQPLKAPAGSPCSGVCNLHLHPAWSGQGGGMYSWGPALGMLIATGNVGPALDSAVINTYMSIDAGASWYRVAPYATIYDFANNGGIVLLADQSAPTAAISFSATMGRSFQQCRLSDDPLWTVDVFNLFPEYSGQGTTLHIYGNQYYNGTMTNGVIISVDFDEQTFFAGSECQNPGTPGAADSDYELWYPDTANGCVLGLRTSYLRRKPDSVCYNSLPSDQLTVESQCACTRADYQCAYCYVLVNTTCVLDKDDDCAAAGFMEPPGCVGEWYQNKGYELIPGTNCSLTMPGAVKLLGSMHKCSGHHAKKGISWIVWFVVALSGVCFLLICAGGIYLYRGYAKFTDFTSDSSFFRLREDDTIPSLRKVGQVN